jgi:TetR/AcrR family transcriptional regulator
MTAKGLEGKSTEDEILNAAEEVFVVKGYSGARVQEIADRAGITQPLLHYYFRSKDNLYRKILVRVAGEFFGHLASAFSERATFEESLGDFISHAIDYLSEHPHAPTFLLHELSQGSSIAGEVLAETLLSTGFALPQRMGALLSREHMAGRIRETDPVQFVVTVIGSCMWLFLAEPIGRGITAELRPGERFDRTKFAEERKKAVFDLLYLGLKARE